MRQSDIKLGELYACGGSYQRKWCGRVVEKKVERSIRRYGSSQVRKDRVRVEIVDSDTGVSTGDEDLLAANRIIETWASYYEKHKEALKKRKADEEARRARKLIVDQRCDAALVALPEQATSLRDALKNAKGRASLEPRFSVTLSDVEELLSGFGAQGYSPVPEGGVKCNNCEKNPAMADHYLCRRCLYGE